MFWKILGGFLLSFFTATAANAIVNLDKLHLDDNQASFSGTARFGLAGASGYSERFRVKSAVDTRWNLKNALYYLSFDYGYGKSNGIEDQNNGFLHVRKIRSLSENIAWEIFSQVEQDKFARLNFRGLVGGGSRFSVSFDNNKYVTHFGLGGFYSRENLISSITATDNGSENIFRANIYLLQRFSFDNNLSIYKTLYVQPSVSDVNDYRVLGVLGFKFALTKRFSLSLSLENTHDSMPPQGVVKTNLNYITSLDYSF